MRLMQRAWPLLMLLLVGCSGHRPATVPVVTRACAVCPSVLSTPGDWVHVLDSSASTLTVESAEGANVPCGDNVGMRLRFRSVGPCELQEAVFRSGELQCVVHSAPWEADVVGGAGSVLINWSVRLVDKCGHSTLKIHTEL
jgi:hypothetical protein